MIQHDLPDLSNRRDIAGIIKNKNAAPQQTLSLELVLYDFILYIFIYEFINKIIIGEKTRIETINP